MWLSSTEPLKKLEKYEILVGNPNAVRWVNVSGKFNLASLGGLRPVEGGREPGGSPQYIAQAPYHGAVHPGKACEDYGHGCYIPYDSTEKMVEASNILAMLTGSDLTWFYRSMQFFATMNKSPSGRKY